LRLIEPLGLLHGRAAADACAAGLAHRLAGGPAAFSLARLHEGGSARLVRTADIPDDWREALARVTAARPAWAGLPTDRPLVMGILNVTPDSFSDGGLHDAPDAAVAHGRRMMAAGADLIDVGGESTRPGAAEVPAADEQHRVLPVVRALAGYGIPVSIDTRHAATMAAALEAGAAIVNDVSGLNFDPAAAPLLRGSAVPVVIQHMRGTPADMAEQAFYADVALDCTRELETTIAAAGLDRARVLADPGIGFAKLPQHNLEVLARLPVLLNLGCRLLVGASRKGFLAAAAAEPTPAARLPGSLACALAAVLGGAAMLRVHDVAATVQALRVWQGIADAA
jgi:dihydropteroate synthase